jgi:tRNA(Ile)-lysidine synthase
LIPRLEAEWNPGLQETLAQTADWAWEEEQYWRTQIRQRAADWVRFEENAAVLDAVRLNTLPTAVARRLIREIVRRVKDDLLGVSFAHIEAIRDLAASPQGAGRRQIAGLQVFRSFNWLRFAKSGDPAPGNWEFSLTLPGRYVVPPGIIDLELIRNDGVYNGSLNALDGESVRSPLVLRNWRAGDSYRRQGHAGVEKVKRLFEEHRIPLWERQDWPVIAVGGRVVWAGKFGPAAGFAVNADSRTVLTIAWAHETSDKV